MGVPQIYLGNPDENAASHCAILRQLRDEGAQISVLPELGLTGYSIFKLAQQAVLQSKALDALRTVQTSTADFDMLLGVGLPLRHCNCLFNVVAVLYRGDILGFVAKKYIPGYGEFREWQSFRGADYVVEPTIRFDGEDIPIGWNLLFVDRENNDLVTHWETCEDGWVGVPPSHLASLYGANVLCNDSASNVTGGKGEYRRVLAQATSGMCNAIRPYVSGGYGETTTCMAWDEHVSGLNM